jgi:predicted Zn-dependent protease
MADANKRIAMLEKLVASGKADAFAHYALGMEYRREGRVDEALATFDTLRQLQASYLPMYLMAGQLLLEHGRAQEAAEWLKSGMELARGQGDMKTLGELESALAGIA